MMKKRLYILLCMALLTSTTYAQEDTNTTIPQSDTTAITTPTALELNLANHDDQVTKFQSRRVDREINKKKFVLKDEFMFGTTASYATISGDNTEVYLLLSGISADCTIASVKPYFGYFYRNNRAIGARLGYSVINGTIDSATIDLGDINDVSMDVPYISLNSRGYSVGLFHRAYAALDDKGHFGVFAEIELSGSIGSSTFSYENNGVLKSTRSENTQLSLSFNPGISAFILHNVCASLSFEFGGVDYTHIRQYNENDEYIGSRNASKMRFKFNVLAINFGLTMHIW